MHDISHIISLSTFNFNLKQSYKNRVSIMAAIETLASMQYKIQRSSAIHIQSVCYVVVQKVTIWLSLTID
jgi:hypothetical protein